MYLSEMVARKPTAGGLHKSLAMHRNPTVIDQNFPHVLAASLHTDFVQKCCLLFVLRR
jgi:hypothetical protein